MMKLVQVIPIVKGIAKGQLSYFTNKEVDIGSVVSVPLRKRNVPGLIVGFNNVEDVKAVLRASSFAIKKILPGKKRAILLKEFTEAAHVASRYFATTVGSLLHQVVPAIILNNIEKIPEAKKIVRPVKNRIVHEKLVLQADEESRLLDYKSLVREEFARGTSIYICVPTIRDAEYISEKLSKGIVRYVFTLHSEVPKGKLLKRIKAVIEEKHPILIVGTGSFLAIPRPDIKTIIVERENARAYKMQSRPFVDFRIFATTLAEKLGARILFADMPLSIKTTWQCEQEEYSYIASHRARNKSTMNHQVIDMRPAEEQGKKLFTVLSPDLIKVIEKSQITGENVFIFNVRRGLAPTTVCEDCGNVVNCLECGAPVVLHTTKNKNVFVCHACGTLRSAKERCRECRSWKLKMLGIGVNRIKNELGKHIPSSQIFSIDSDATKTYKKAAGVSKEFYKTKGGVLVGTELSLSFLKKPVAYSAIASIDSLLSLPDVNMYEHIFSLLIRVESLAVKSFFLQTRQPELSFIKHAVTGDIRGFYRDEIKSRQRFNYPPFTVLIKISARGGSGEVAQEMSKVEKHFRGYIFHIYPAFTPLSKGKYMLHGLLKVPSSAWPDEKLLSLLHALPPNLSVNVGPESTL